MESLGQISAEINKLATRRRKRALRLRGAIYRLHAALAQGKQANQTTVVWLLAQRHGRDVPPHRDRTGCSCHRSRCLGVSAAPGRRGQHALQFRFPIHPLMLQRAGDIQHDHGIEHVGAGGVHAAKKIVPIVLVRRVDGGQEAKAPARTETSGGSTRSSRPSRASFLEVEAR